MRPRKEPYRNRTSPSTSRKRARFTDVTSSRRVSAGRRIRFFRGQIRGFWGKIVPKRVQKASLAVD